MANGDYEIDEATFKSMPLDSQNWIMYRTFNAHRLLCDHRICAIESKMDKIDKLRNKLVYLASGFGIAGGAGVTISFRDLFDRFFK